MNRLSLAFLFFVKFLMVDANQTCAGELCIPDDYDMFHMPEEQLQVEIGIRVVEVLEINDKDFSAEFYMYFAVSWNDARLINYATAGTTLRIETSFMQYMWVPDIYIYNLKSFYSSTVLTDFAGLIPFIIFRKTEILLLIYVLF